MPIVTNNQYRLWLKITVNMKLSSNASVLSITYEGLTNFQYFIDFNHDSIKSLLKACIKDIDSIVSDVPNWIFSKNAVLEKSISKISTRQLVVTTNTVKYYITIGRTLTLKICTTLICLGSLRRTTMPTSC